MNSPADELERKLRWRSRRGMLELDLLLVPFVEEVYPFLTNGLKQSYAKLLEEDDPDLQEWFSKRKVPEDAGLAEIVSTILDRARQIEFDDQ